MRNLLALAAFALIAFAGIGWYQGWYTFASKSTPDGHHHVEIDIDKNKIQNDFKKGEKAVAKRLKDDAESEAKKQIEATLPSDN